MKPIAKRAILEERARGKHESLALRRFDTNEIRCLCRLPPSPARMRITVALGTDLMVVRVGAVASERTVDRWNRTM